MSDRFATHAVTNQPPPLTDVNLFASDVALADAIAREGAASAARTLNGFGLTAGSEEAQELAYLANMHPPKLETHDRFGRRLDVVTYHPAYHDLMRLSCAEGIANSTWTHLGPAGGSPDKAAHVVRAAHLYLATQMEPGHCCPLTMTNAAVPVLMKNETLAQDWLPLLLSRTYDPRFEPAADKSGAMIGMAMTEKQGGSDVRANTTVAVPAGPGGPGADYLLTGHKWFCSAPMSDAFLVLAQAHGPGGEGLSCFLVPRVLPDGARNVFRIQRLKDKLGNRANASSEIEFDGTVATMVGDPGRGVRTIIEMVARTRLDCVLGSAAGMRQAVAEATWHARHRAAFGRVLVDQPAMANVLADLALESEAATVTAIRLARAYDVDAGEEERGFRRVATAVAKYWICKRGPQHAYEALECLGGNGYTEEFPLAMRYREQPVMAVWEGSGNVIALDLLRAMRREPESLTAFGAELELARGHHRILDDTLDRLDRQLRELSAADPESAERRARSVVESMALALQATLLARFSPTSVSEAFIAARLGPDRGHEYGTLPEGSRLTEIMQRH